MKRSQMDKKESSQKHAESKFVYETPTLSYHGEWQALTLQFSIPISIEEEGSVTYRR